MTVPPPPNGPAAQDPYGSAAAHDPYGGPAAGSPAGHAAPHAGPAQTGPAPTGPAPTGPAPGPAPGTDLGADLGAALRFAGRGLLRSAGALLGTGALYGVLMLVVLVGGFALTLVISIAMIESSSSAGGDPTLGQSLVILALSFVLVLVTGAVGALWQSGAAQAGGILADGGRPSFRQALVGTGRTVATAVLVLVIVMIGSVLLYLPGLIAAVMLLYAIPAAVRGASPGAALKESIALARANLGTTIVGFLVTMMASYAGGMILIGMLAAIPFMMLFQVALHARVSGREVPEPARA